MSLLILESKDLPEALARKIKGDKVEVVETEEGVLLRTVRKSILPARGMLAGRGVTVEDFLRLKREDRELE